MTSERVALAPVAAPSPQTGAARAPSTAHINLQHDGDGADDDHRFAPTQIPDAH